MSTNPTNKTGECCKKCDDVLGSTGEAVCNDIICTCHVSRMKTDQETTLRERFREKFGDHMTVRKLRGPTGYEVFNDIEDFIQEETQRAYERGKNDIDALSGYVEQGRLEERARVREAAKDIIGKHNARVLNAFQREIKPDLPMICFDERVALVPAITKATEETLATLDDLTSELGL